MGNMMTRVGVAVCTLFACLAGCGTSGGGDESNGGSKITAQNFLRIDEGMNHQDVTVILGEPSEKLGSYPNPRVWKWKEGGKVITAVIDRNGNVEAKTKEGL